ncbi:preprotein translocase subunit SecA [Lewinellaceae bacterium SD302]|nr:preprotein translocase subunit SecA [Lewinellaceae bacterium SD302]
MFSALKKLFGSKQDRDLEKYEPVVDKINEVYATLSGLSHDELRNKTIEFRERIAEYLSDIDAERENLKAAAEAEEDLNEKEIIFQDLDKLKLERNEALEVILNELLPEAFAVMKETARRFTENETISVTATQQDRDLAAHTRKNYVTIEGDQAVYRNSWTAAGGEITWAMVHYDVQLIGGMVLHDGKIAEMMTGEGKTLVATLPAYLNGLSGQGVHVITVNDYLARRDCEWIGPVMEFLHLTIDCLDHYKPNSPERRAAYKCDITYGTNNEFGFDYLRDNMVGSIDDKVQVQHHYAMIDEVDSVLIDEARTPLIISGPVPKGSELQEYEELKHPIEQLLEAQRKAANKFLTEAKKLWKEGYIGVEDGEAGFALLRSFRALPKNRALIKFLSEEGVRALLTKTENTFMEQNNKRMDEIDEELYFVIDEKNRTVDLTEKGNEFLAKYNSDPKFFIMRDVATAMAEIDLRTELSKEEKQLEKNRIAQDFAVKSRRLHAIHQLVKAYTLFEKEEEYVVMDGQVKIVDEQTGRMMDGRRYSDGLHQALEAKENVKVGDITQTYATITLQNYFRMYHKLSGMTGTAETEAGEFWEIYKLDVVVIPTNRPIQRDDKNDRVYKTEREKVNAVIEEVVRLSKAGRPILVGTTTVEISERLSRMLRMAGIDHNVLNAKQHQREAEIVAEAGKPGKVTIATNMAGRGTDIKLSPEVLEAGGLAIIGTERHDSRRVDRQLRGRAGRQGDPGSSQFYVSLEDKLMRYFNSERTIKWMDRAGLKEGDVIEASIVTKSIENAQKKVEENNFGTRKRLLEYDDVMNIQREAIYTKRNNALSGERMNVDLKNMFEGLIESLAFETKQNGDYDTFRRANVQVLGFEPEIDEAEFGSNDVNTLGAKILEQFQAFYNDKMGKLSAVLMEQIRRVHEEQPGRYRRILLPFSDGSSNPMAITADINRAIESDGATIKSDIEQAVVLATIDERWKEHLREMDDLKTSTYAASFEQKDPLVIYKMEAYKLFEQLIMSVNEATTGYLAKGNLAFPERKEEPVIRQAPSKAAKSPKLSTNRAEATQQAARAAGQRAGQRQKVETFVRQDKKIGRNDPCPCGSGKKYKQCHGK